MNIPRPIDAELVSLLHEITDDPAKLLSSFTNRLRRTKHELPQSLALDQDDFFNQSERRMLRRHREEIGDLLYEKCLLFMQETPRDKGMIEWRYKGIGVKALTKKQYIELSLIEGLQSKDAKEIGIHFESPVDRKNIVSVAELALRLHPTFWCKSLLAMVLKEGKLFDSASKLLASFEMHILNQRQKSVVLGNRSFVLCSKGEHRSGLPLTKSAFLADETRVAQAFSLAAMELCFGDKSSLLNSARFLETVEFEENGFGEIEFIQFQLDLRKGDSGYRKSMDKSQFELIDSIAERLPSRTRKLANAIVQKD